MTNTYICLECKKVCILRPYQQDNKPIIFDLEHKDGSSTNNKEDNLCCLCPNCHSQTSTYKAKNKGNGRESRRKINK